MIWSDHTAYYHPCGCTVLAVTKPVTVPNMHYAAAIQIRGGGDNLIK